jgi:hypothetical protein
MWLFRKTAVRPKLNQIGKPFKGVLPIEQWIGLADEDIADLIEMGYVPQMAGGTTPRNQVAESPIYFPRAIVVSTDQTINQGDSVWWDPFNYTLKPCITAAQVAVTSTGGYCGSAAGSNVPGVYPNPPAGLPSENLPGIVVQCGGSVWLNLQSNDVVDYPFQAVTMAGVDAQTVTKGGASLTNRVGFVIVPPPVVPRVGPPGATPLSETVAGGSAIRVWVERKFPSLGLL